MPRRKFMSYFHRLFLIILTTLFSVAAQTQEAMTENAPAATPSQKGGMESRIDQEVPDREKAWLMAGDLQQIAFYLSETTGTAHGGVILLPDYAKHPAEAGMINTLRHTLSDNHWHTLAVSLLNTNEQQAQQLIAAAIKHFNNQGVYNLAILGEGVGAAQAIHFAASLPPSNNPRQPNQIRAVILYDGKNAIPGSDVATLEKLSTVSVPVLDAYSNSDFEAKQLAEKRKSAARRLMNNRNYQQIRLPMTTGLHTEEDNRITKRFRGWLDNNAAGFMVDR